MDSSKNNPVYSNTDTSKVDISEDEWKKILPSDVYQVARQKFTERPWSSPLESIKDKGTYYCAVCGNALFVSDTKFESGCGWPSFYQPIAESAVLKIEDISYGMVREEIVCSQCGGHLGHVRVSVWWRRSGAWTVGRSRNAVLDITHLRSARPRRR